MYCIKLVVIYLPVTSAALFCDDLNVQVDSTFVSVQLKYINCRPDLSIKGLIIQSNENISSENALINRRLGILLF